VPWADMGQGALAILACPGNLESVTKLAERLLRIVFEVHPRPSIGAYFEPVHAEKRRKAPGYEGEVVTTARRLGTRPSAGSASQFSVGFCSM